MLVTTLLLSTLSALALARSPTNPNLNPCEPTNSDLIKATWIAPRTFPNCGFAGVGCGSGKSKGGKRVYYCAPFRATCCQNLPEPRARRSRMRRQENAEEDQAEADAQVQDVSKDREDDGEDDQGEDLDEGDEPLFEKVDYKRSYCPDGYECTGGGRWCKRRPDATINTNQPGSTASSTTKSVWSASYLGTSVTLVNTVRPVKPPVKTPPVKLD